MHFPALTLIVRVPLAFLLPLWSTYYHITMTSFVMIHLDVLDLAEESY